MMMGNKNPMDMLGKGLMDGDDDSQEQGSDKSGKLLALQNMLGAIEDLTDEDLKPYIEELRQKLHVAHEAEENDSMGLKNALEGDSDSDMPPMPKVGGNLEIGIAMNKMKGKPEELNKDLDKPMSSQDDDEEEDLDLPKDGFLAILAKKMKKKD